MTDIRDLARFYKALADETRLRLVELLTRQAPDRLLCVGRLAQQLHVTSSAVSQHLRVLKSLGLVRGERRGCNIHYRLDQERLAVYEDLARARLGNAFATSGTRDQTEDQDREETRPMGCCDSKATCAHPEKLQGIPGECTPDQVCECHGDAAEHQCECSKEKQTEE